MKERIDIHPDFYITLIDQSEIKQKLMCQYRATVWWKLGGYATNVDGDDKDQIVKDVEQKMLKVFCNSRNYDKDMKRI